MSKYIDADRLKAEIERFSATEYGDNTFGDDIANGALDYVLEEIIPSLQQEQSELQPIGYAETYYQKGLHDGIIKGRMEILKKLEDIEKRKAEPVIVIKQQEQPEVDLEKEIRETYHNGKEE